VTVTNTTSRVVGWVDKPSTRDTPIDIAGLRSSTQPTLRIGIFKFEHNGNRVPDKVILLPSLEDD
jgi:hypothetical protein